MSFNKQSILLKSFSWWISNDDVKTTWNQVLDTNNMDLNRNSDFISLYRASGWRFVTTATINGFFEVKSSVFCYTSDWKIYTASWTLKYTFAWNPSIQQAWNFNRYVYFLDENQVIYKISEPNVTLWNWAWNVATVTVWWDWFTSNGNTYPVVVLLNEQFYIWAWDDVYQITKTDISTKFDIWDWAIVWITRIWWVFRIYTDKWTIAFWDWLADSIDSFIEVWESVRAVINNWQIDYIIAGWWKNQSNIYVLNGYQTPELLKGRYSDILQRTLFKIDVTNVQDMAKLWTTIYFRQEWINGDEILSYWTWNPVLPNGFNKFMTEDSNWNVIDTVYSLYGLNWLDWDTLYVWMNSNSEKAVEKISISWWTSFSYQTNWYIITNPFDWNTKINHKKIEEIQIITSDCDVNNTIEIQYSIDWWTFTSLTTINTWSWITKTIEYPNDDFYTISYKCIFIWDLNNTPKLYEINTIYTIIE